MTGDRQTAIAKAFGAAEHYDRHAGVQRIAADALADRIAALRLPSPRLLEFGCGTGFLTEAMDRRGIGGEWLVTDLTPEMVERCRQRMARRAGLTFAVLDAAQDEPPKVGCYNLITASLAAQWLGDLDVAVSRMLRWLKPGGHLLFNTLASGTFHEWRLALAEAGVRASMPTYPTPQYPTLAQIAAIRPDVQAQTPDAAILADLHPDARSFLASLKAIGAHVPAAGHRPAGPTQMRAAMRHFEAHGCTTSYEVVTCHFRAPLC